MSKWGKVKLLIAALGLLIGLLGIIGAVYYIVQEYIQFHTFGHSEYFIGAAIGIFWAGWAGFVSYLFLYFLRKEMPVNINMILTRISIIYIVPTVIYFLVVILLMLSSSS